MLKPSRWLYISSMAAGASLVLTLILAPQFTSNVLAADQASFKYTGAGSCSAAKCHGSASDKRSGATLTNEYTVWASKDKHNSAFKILFENEAKEILKKYDGGTDPSKSDKCLTCHTTGDATRYNMGLDYVAYKDKSFQGPKFDVEGGVSCESCHGPAEKWIQDHSKEGWTDEMRAKYKTSKALFAATGLWDTKEIMMRADNCVSCHLRIDSKMIDAGHPTLGFELAFYSNEMPPHWKDKDAWFTGTAWVAGQAATLREALDQLADYAGKGAGGDLITEAADRARTNALLLRHGLPSAADTLNKLAADIAAAGGDKGKLTAVAKAGTASIAGWTDSINGMKFDEDKTFALVQKLFSDQDLAAIGYGAFQQQYNSIDSVYGTYAASAENAKEAGMEAVDGILDQMGKKVLDADDYTDKEKAIAKQLIQELSKAGKTLK